MRDIFDHIIRQSSFEVSLTADDAPGPGGANHLYTIRDFSSASNPSDPWFARHGNPSTYSTVLFQNGAILETGTNGVTNEVLLAVVMDRLRGFQSGKFACRQNALALTNIETGLHWLQQRTIERLRRGVEGMSRP